MPLYFFLSGLFFKDYGGLKKTILRKVDKLILPFLFFALTSVLAFSLYNLIITNIGLSSEHKINTYLFDDQLRLLIGAIWFLLCLFWQSVIYFGINKIKNINLQCTLTILIACVAVILANSNIKIPLHIDSAMLGFPFYYLGSLIKKRSNILEKNNYDRYAYIIAIIFLLVSFILGAINNEGTVFYHANEYTGSIILNYLQSISIILAAIFFFKKIKRIPIVSYLGRYSIIALGLHCIFIAIFNSLAKAGIINVDCYIIYPLVVFLCIICIKPLTNYFPKFTAQENFLSSSF